MLIQSTRWMSLSGNPPNRLGQPHIDGPEPEEAIIVGAPGVFAFAAPNPLITRTTAEAPEELIGYPTKRMPSARGTREFVLANLGPGGQVADRSAVRDPGIQARHQIARFQGQDRQPREHGGDIESQKNGVQSLFRLPEHDDADLHG